MSTDEDIFYDVPSYESDAEETERENDLKNFQKTIDTFSKKYKERLNNNKILQDEVAILSGKNKNDQDRYYYRCFFGNRRGFGLCCGGKTL